MRGGASLATLTALFALAACGGGGTSGAPTPAPPPPGVNPAVLSVSLAGGASPNVDHLWVTVTGVALNQDPARAFGDGDPSWVVQMLANPITVDLAGAELGAGHAVSLFKNNISQLGTYAQLRLLVASSDPDAPLADSAKALGLERNDQVQYTDAIGTHTVPLEIPDLQAGLRAGTPFTLSDGATTPLALEWNARDGIVHRLSGLGADRFVVRNELQLYNQQLLTALEDGLDPSLFDAISGQLDITDFCTAGAQQACIRNVVATATSLAADASFHVAVRSVDVAASGSFVLYPLPSDSVYDVVIRGDNMQTIVVRNVFVDPTGILKPFPTALSSPSTPIVPVLDLTGRTVALSQPLDPAGSRVFFGQTVRGSGGGGGNDLPYELVTANADPFTGNVVDRITVPGGPLHVAVFDPKVDGLGTPPAFTTVSSTEGDGAFSVWTQGTRFDSTSSLALLAAGDAAIAAPSPVPRPGFTNGTLTANLAGASSNGADRGELIVSNDGGTVVDLDVSAQVAAGGGAVPVTAPSGESADVPGAAWYGVALRTWKASDESRTTLWVRSRTPIDLASTTTASVALTLP